MKKEKSTSKAIADGIPVYCEHSQVLDVEKLKPNPRNPNKHSKAQIELLAKNIKSLGWRHPITVSTRSGFIVAGHGRHMASQLLGVSKIPVDFQHFSSDAEEFAVLLADNKIAELAEIDKGTLKSILSDLDGEMGLDDMELTGYSDEEIKALLAGEENASPSLNMVPAVEKETLSRPGDIWDIQNGPRIHRLVCGDSTDQKHLALFADRKADLVFTDPPYGVSYVSKASGAIKNDELREDGLGKMLRGAFELAIKAAADHAPFYIWHASSTRRDFEWAMQAVGLEEKQYIVWVKDSFTLGRSDYHWQTEPCQPAGTMVLKVIDPRCRTLGRGAKALLKEVPIEEIKNGDRVVSYNPYESVVRKRGRSVKVTNRMYDGKMFSVSADGKTTQCTSEHQFSIRMDRSRSNSQIVYLMRKGDRWRIGHVALFNTRGFGLSVRLTDEDGDEAWAISLEKDRLSAKITEQVLSCKFCIPTTHWEVDIYGVGKKFRTKEGISEIYDRIGSDRINAGARSLLSEYGRQIEYPLIRRGAEWRFSRVRTRAVRACNLMAEIMQVPIPSIGDDFKWASINSVLSRPFIGQVYSMDVHKDHHYVADGIITHNCFYAQKAGCKAQYFGGRAQSTAWRIRCVAKSDLCMSIGKGVRISNGEGVEILIRPKAPKAGKIRLVRTEQGGASIFLAEESSQTDAWEVSRDSKPDLVHPTQKPIDLACRAILNGTQPGQLVLDVFGGSGSTMVAAEHTSRESVTIELDPVFADVGVKRFLKAFPGSIASRAGKQALLQDFPQSEKSEVP